MRSDIDAAIRAVRGAAEIGLHLGAGSTRIEGLINCDLFNPDAERKLDAVDLGEIDDGTVDLLEHHHMIEHLSFADFEKAMMEWHRILRPGGLLIFTCPDIKAVCKQYLAYSWVPGRRDRDQKIDYVIKMLVGSQEHEGMFHKNHFDAERVRRLIPSYGFNVDFTYSTYPKRPTPSLLVVARKV